MGVNSVTAGDASIVIGGTAANPTVETGSLDQIASLHPPVAPVSFGSEGITNVASAAIAESSATGGLLTVYNSHVTPSSPTVQYTAQSAADLVLGVDVTGDANYRLVIDSNGRLLWSSGAAATDINMQRTSAGVLTVNGSLRASAANASGLVGRVTNTTATPTAPNYQIVSAAAGDSAFALDVSGDTVNRLLIDSNGKHNWGPGGATAADTDLYRSAAGVLKTDQSFAVGTNLTVAGTTVLTDEVTVPNGVNPTDAAAFGQLPQTQAQPAGFQPANPASTVSTTLVMMGLGTTVTYTPSGSGKVLVNVTGQGQTATSIAQITVGPRYGAGTAPANGVAVTGTRFGTGADIIVRGGNAANVPSGFSFTDVLILTPGTTYWFDMGLATGTAADAASVVNMSLTFVEVA